MKGKCGWVVRRAGKEGFGEMGKGIFEGRVLSLLH